MAESKASKDGGSGRGKTKNPTSKRRSSNAQNQTKKPPSKAAQKQAAKDWDQVT